jgi:hypothetical protein
MRWGDGDEATLRLLWPLHRGRIGRIARIMGKSPGAISGKSRVLGLQFQHSEKKPLAEDHPAVVDGRTVFPSRVTPADLNVLKSGGNQRKLGGKVTKGRWKGFPIYSLTLEERATCPHTCRQWKSCYGNNMQWAIRYQHGPDLERALARELAALQRRHPRGFVVRLHILGDFYSIPYVHFWGDALEEFPALNIFGYTHHQLGRRMGDAVAAVRAEFRDRFCVRHSDAYSGYRTGVIQEASQAGDRIICPAQTGRTANCGTCGLCWGTKRPIAFLAH